jgi:hypothetical protein
MKATYGLFDVPAIGSIALGILAAVIGWAILANTRLPLIRSERAAFFVVAAIGLTMCAVGGIGRSTAALGWSHPINLLGILLGVLAFGLVIAVLAGRTGWLSSATTIFNRGAVAQASGERVALLAMMAIILLKWTLGLAKYFLR